jgi:hypothetical protein
MREFTDEPGNPRSIPSCPDEPIGHRPETREGDIPMTAGQSTQRSNGSLAPAPLAALLAATLLGGAMIGAGIALQLGSTDGVTATIGTAAHPAAIFDAPAFRAEEHRALAGNRDFDAPAFRAEEHRALAGNRDFDAPAFRVEEHRALAGTPASGPLSLEHRDRIGGP